MSNEAKTCGPEFGYDSSGTGERFTGPFDSVNAAIIDYVMSDPTVEAGDTVSICEVGRIDPNTLIGGLSDDIEERIAERLFDEVGEAADTFMPSKCDNEWLESKVGEVVRQWLDRVGINCWKAVDPRPVTISPEHVATAHGIAARAALTLATKESQ